MHRAVALTRPYHGRCGGWTFAAKQLAQPRSAAFARPLPLCRAASPLGGLLCRSGVAGMGSRDRGAHFVSAVPYLLAADPGHELRRSAGAEPQWSLPQMGTL